MKRFKRVAVFGILSFILLAALTYGCSLVNTHDMANDQPTESNR
ncbi:MAG: hypothetical protein ABIE74_09660 [Pseudomonadota bacterium]